MTHSHLPRHPARRHWLKASGIGLGGALLRAGELHARQGARQGARCIASVLAHNVGSQRLFESAGYHLDDGAWCKPAEVSPPSPVTHFPKDTTP